MTAERWTTIHVRQPRDRTAVIRALFSEGAEGVQELDTEVVTSIRDVDLDRVRAALRQAGHDAEVEAAPTPMIDWSTAWKDRIGAHRLGRIVVAPPWLAGDVDPAELVEIDPGMAFGTGEHETTRGVIRLMQGVIRPGDLVADLGAGSAVLAITAARLGAGRAVAIEVDPDAIGNAEENVVRNGVADRVTVIQGDAEPLLPLTAPVRVVLANIVSSVLLSLLPVIRASLTEDGRAILSGILLEERAIIQEALVKGDWRIESTDEEGLWWSVVIAKG